jgi:hypothetical protein
MSLIGCSAMKRKTGQRARIAAPAAEKRRESPSSRPRRKARNRLISAASGLTMKGPYVQPATRLEKAMWRGRPGG